MSTTIAQFEIPTKESVSPANAAIFDQLEKQIGFVPNLYAFFAKSDTALADYLALQHRKSTLNTKEREVVNLVTSQINGCRYCQSAHTEIGKMNGFTIDQVLEIRSGSASFDSKLDALAKFTSSIVKNKGNADAIVKDEFFNAGYSEANMVDLLIVVGDKIMSNYLHNLTGFEIDFPLAQEIA
ncbi:MAG: putative peroxidase-related enzyme [Flavobacteriales bacterium]|jgi:uncharacterized peroxidase-related enzyme